jgi:hypothetical protein
VKWIARTFVHTMTLCGVLVTTLGGCAMTLDANALGVKASVAEPAGIPVEGAEFRIDRKSVYLLFGAVRASQPSLEEVLAGQLVDGAEVANLRVKVRSRFVDVFVTVLTAGLVVPRSVTIEGVVVGGRGEGAR